MTTTCLQTSMNAATNLRGALTLAPQAGLTAEMVAALPELQSHLDSDFPLLCHQHQDPPALANNGKPWTTWLVLGGRGAGKTRLGAEWVRAAARGTPPYAQQACRHIALIEESEHDVREVMIEGVSGLLRISPRAERPLWMPSRRRLEWATGAVAQAFSAEDPESLRGPQFDAAWCDELAKWRLAKDTWDMLQFGLRLGHWPRQLITTTPRAVPLLKRLLSDPGAKQTHAKTLENEDNLAPTFLETVVRRYGGRRPRRRRA